MKQKLMIFMVLVGAMLLPSCYATRTWVGDYREEKKVEKMGTYKYSKSKQAYLFWGLMPIGHTRVATPADGNCEIRTRHGFFDAFVTAITGGIFSVQTIKVNALRENNSSRKKELKDAQHEADLEAVRSGKMRID